MPTLYKRPNGKYYVAYWHDGVQYRKSLRTSDKALATEVFKDFEANHRLGLLGLPTKKYIPTMQDLFDEYLPYSKGNKSLRSQKDDKAYIDKFLSPVFGKIRTTDLNNKHVEAFIGMLKNWQHEDGRIIVYHPRTINLRLQSLRAILRRAVRNGDITSMPVTIQLLRCPRSLPKYVTPNDFATWAKHIKEPLNRWRAILSLCTSISDRDLGRLTWKDSYDRELGIIKYRRRKTGKDIVITMNKWAKETMTRLWEIKDGPYLFQGNKSARQAYRFASMNSGVHVTPHMLRHSFATWALSAGQPIASVSAIMGHEDIQTTQIYAQVMPQFLAATTNAIDTMRHRPSPRKTPKKPLQGKTMHSQKRKKPRSKSDRG
jgi:integrase